jgi:hypothetical protein
MREKRTFTKTSITDLFFWQQKVNDIGLCTVGAVSIVHRFTVIATVCNFKNFGIKCYAIPVDGSKL